MAAVEKVQTVTPADWVPGPQQGSWTYEDYLALEDDQRYEVVSGVLVMAPSPTDWHQRVAGRIFYYLVTHVDLPGRGHVYQAPLDVRLNHKNVFQPDVFVVLTEHLERVTERGVIGAPDLVIEVASPGTAAYDRITKYEAYARAGVPEYWIVKLDTRTVEVLILENGVYKSAGIFHDQSFLPSRIVADLPVRVELFFPES